MARTTIGGWWTMPISHWEAAGEPRTGLHSRISRDSAETSWKIGSMYNINSFSKHDERHRNNHEIHYDTPKVSVERPVVPRCSDHDRLGNTTRPGSTGNYYDRRRQQPARYFSTH